MFRILAIMRVQTFSPVKLGPQTCKSVRIFRKYTDISGYKAFKQDLCNHRVPVKISLKTLQEISNFREKRRPSRLSAIIQEVIAVVL